MGVVGKLCSNMHPPAFARRKVMEKGMALKDEVGLIFRWNGLLTRKRFDVEERNRDYQVAPTIMGDLWINVFTNSDVAQGASGKTMWANIDMQVAEFQGMIGFVAQKNNQPHLRCSSRPGESLNVKAEFWPGTSKDLRKNGNRTAGDGARNGAKDWAKVTHE